MKEGHQLESLFKKYDMIFNEDLGTLQSVAATLHVKPNSMPKPCLVATLCNKGIHGT